MYTIDAVSAMPTTEQPSMRQRIGASGHTSQVTTTNPTSDSPADHHSPVYSADMILWPGLFLTSEQPTIEARMETPPSSIGYTVAAPPVPGTTSAPSSIVATSVTT